VTPRIKLSVRRWPGIKEEDGKRERRKLRKKENMADADN